jgi:hypothetical protein
MNKTIEITADEAKVVASLLDLYDGAWADVGSQQFREALEAAGNHDYRLFDSISEKVGRKTPSHDTDPA